MIKTMVLLQTRAINLISLVNFFFDLQDMGNFWWAVPDHFCA